MQRDFSLQRGVIDLDTGQFPVTLFTNGDAADGHIIHVAGLVTEKRVPMFVNHAADPTTQMGSLFNPHKVGKSTRLGGARMTFDARINMDGDGASADIRRDVANMIANGDITGMSGRWDAIGEPVPRATLAKTHYAFSEASKDSFSPGLFFETARVKEGSIVGLGSDQAALIGRSQDTKRPEHVRAFYRTLVEGDALTREEALRCLLEQASAIDGLVQVETESGPFFVPKEIERVWGESLEEDEFEDDTPIDPELLKQMRDVEDWIDAPLTKETQSDSREESSSDATDETPEPFTLPSAETSPAFIDEIEAINRAAKERYEATLLQGRNQIEYRERGKVS